MLQDDQLVMLGLGSDGSSNFAEGIHLRWSFNLDRGWPKYGFELWRREAVPLEYTKFVFKKDTLTATKSSISSTPFSLSAPAKTIKPIGKSATVTTVTKTAFSLTGKGGLASSVATYTVATTATQAPVTLESDRAFTYDAANKSIKTSGAGTLTVVSTQPLCGLSVWYVATRGEIVCIGTDAGTEVVARKETANNAKQKIELRADRFNAATITWSHDIEIIGLAWSVLPPTISITVNGWNKLGMFNLPGDLVTAKNRITMPAVTTTGVNYDDQWVSMDRLIKKSLAGETSLSETNGDETRTLNVSPLQLLLMSGVVDTNIARMLGVYYIDTKTDRTKRYDYALVGRWEESSKPDPKLDSRLDQKQNLTWLCFDLAVSKPQPVTAPSGLQVTAKELLGGVYKKAHGVSSAKTQTGAAISWTPSKSYGGKSEHKSAVYYHILRQDHHGGSFSAPRTLTKKRPILVSSINALSTTRTSASTSASRATEPGYYIDGPLNDGDYRYSIVAYDIFGRASAPSSGVAHTSRDTVAPPPPANVRSYYHASSTGASTLDVSWDWLAPQMEQAADADTFSIYVVTENVAPLETIVQSTSSSGTPARTPIQVTTDLDPAADYSLYVNGWFIQSGQRLRITAVAGGGGSSPVVLTVATPDTSRSAVSGGSGGSTAAAATKPISTKGTATGKRTYLKTIASAEDYQGRAMITPDWGDHTIWPAVKLTVPISSGIARTSETSDSGDYLHFSASVSGISLATSRTTAIVNGLVGVSTTDKTGNQGRVSSPAIFQAVHSQAPDTPSGLLGDAVVYATRADSLGNSYVDLSFTADSDVYYQILRTTDTILALASGASDATAISDDDLLALANNDDYSTLFVNVGAKNGSGEVLSSNDATSSDASSDAADSDTTSGTSTITYKDTLPGTGNCRYVYRIKAVDKAGNASSLSAAANIVKLIDVTPPAAVVMNRVTGGDKSIVLSWQSNRESDLAGYYVYRTDDSTKTNDIRDMEQIATVPKLEEYTASQWYTDGTGIIGLTDYYYRVTAYDTSGNESTPSAVITGRAYDTTPPSKPVVTALSRSGGSGSGGESGGESGGDGSDNENATIQWACDSDATCMLQRQSGSGGIKTTIAGWSLRGTRNESSGLWEFNTTDSGLSADKTYKYYLACMSASGLVSETTESEEV